MNRRVSSCVFILAALLPMIAFAERSQRWFRVYDFTDPKAKLTVAEFVVERLPEEETAPRIKWLVAGENASGQGVRLYVSKQAGASLEARHHFSLLGERVAESSVAMSIDIAGSSFVAVSGELASRIRGNVLAIDYDMKLVKSEEYFDAISSTGAIDEDTLASVHGTIRVEVDFKCTQERWSGAGKLPSARRSTSIQDTFLAPLRPQWCAEALVKR